MMEPANLGVAPPLFAGQGVSASTPSRVGAFCAAALILVVGAMLSFGAVLLAPIGMWALRVFLRRRGRPLSRMAGWIAATVSVVIALLAMAGIVASLLPPGKFTQIMAASDSASAVSAKDPPPAWLERIAPETKDSAAEELPATSPMLAKLFMVWGGGVAVMLMGSLYGTLGWAGGMLSGLALRGYWPGERDEKRAVTWRAPSSITGGIP